MEDKRGQTIFLSVVGVATLLVAIVGATFAYFSITVEGNDEATSVIVTTATLTSITFDDGAEVKVENIYPGGYAEKTFTISANNPVGNDADAVPTEYQIHFHILDQTLLTAIEADAVGSLAEVEHSLLNAAASKNNGFTGDIRGTLAVQAEAQLTSSTNTTQDIPVGTVGTIYPGVTHTYTYHLEFKEAGDRDQNYAQGKYLNGKLQVTATSEANYTTGSGGSGSSRLP